MAIKVTSGKQVKAPRLFIIGTQKAGKTTLASGAAKPYFIDLENGTVNLDVARDPEPPTTFDALLSKIEAFATEAHDYRTLVIDPISRVEPMIWDAALAEYNKTAKHKVGSIPEIEFQKGYDLAVPYWRRMVATLERLWLAKNMTIVLIDHTAIRNFKDPNAVADYQRIESSVDRKGNALLQRWCDAVLFADFRTELAITGEGKTQRVKAMGVGERVLRTERGAAFDGGNRYNLPAEMPLDWGLLAKGIAASLRAEKVNPKDEQTKEVA